MDEQRPTEPRAGICKDSGRHWFRSFLAGLGTCLLIAVVLTALVIPFWGIKPRAILMVLTVNTIISTAIGLSVSNLYRWVWPSASERVRGRIGRALLHTIFAAVGVGVGGQLGLFVLQGIGFDTGSMRVEVFQIGLVVVIIVLAYTLAYGKLKDHARRVELREHETRQNALRAQLEALQARTDPHFLFNTLNTVAGLIEEDPRMAERMLERLSSVFRYALSGSRTAWVRLEEELQAVRDYLEVEQIRFGERLQVVVDVAPGAGETLVPPLIVQPLVENAVLHGIGSRTSGGLVRIDVARHNPELVLRVEDDGPGPGRSTHRGAGTSLDNLRERLRLVYGGRASVETAERDGGGFSVTLRLPVEEPA